MSRLTASKADRQRKIDREEEERKKAARKDPPYEQIYVPVPGALTQYPEEPREPRIRYKGRNEMGETVPQAARSAQVRHPLTGLMQNKGPVEQFADKAGSAMAMGARRAGNTWENLSGVNLGQVPGLQKLVPELEWDAEDLDEVLKQEGGWTKGVAVGTDAVLTTAPLLFLAGALSSPKAAAALGRLTSKYGITPVAADAVRRIAASNKGWRGWMP